MSAGKGDTPRPVNGEQFRQSYDRIFGKDAYNIQTTRTTPDIHGTIPALGKLWRAEAHGVIAHGETEDDAVSNLKDALALDRNV
jgi:hypothetical protein